MTKRLRDSPGSEDARLRTAFWATLRMTSAAVNLVAARARRKAFSAENMEAIVADIITFSRIKAGFAGKRIEGFHYRVVGQRKLPRLLASLH